MNKVSDMARFNQCLDAVKVHFPTAREFHINHPHISSCKNKNREGYWGRVRMTPSFPPCACVFSVHEACAILLKRGKGLSDSPKHSWSHVARTPQGYPSRIALQVCSPKFIGRAGGFLCSGLRGGWRQLDSLGNSSEQP